MSNSVLVVRIYSPIGKKQAIVEYSGLVQPSLKAPFTQLAACTFFSK